MNREFKRLPLSSLKEAERNVRIHSDTQIEELKRSVNKWGQTRAIVCDENYHIMIGNGLFSALTQLGWTEADCYVYSGLTENDKKKMMMADNKIYTLGVDNLDVMEQFITEMKDFDIPGYDPSLLETLCFEFDDADDYMTGYGVIDDATKTDMERASEKYTKKEATFASSAREITPLDTESALQQQQNDFTHAEHVGAGGEKSTLETQRNALEKRFLVCPKCGERIWL